MRPIEQQFFNDLEKKLWTAADKLRSNLDAAVYKHVVLGLIFLKYVSDAFEERQRELRAQFTDPAHDYCMDPAEYGAGDPAEYEKDIAAELEVRDYYTEKNVFWVPLEARWKTLRDCAQLPPKAPLPWNKPGKSEREEMRSVGWLIDNAMDAVERENVRLKNVLNKDFARVQLDSSKLAGLIGHFSDTDFSAKEYKGQPLDLKSKDILGHVYEYFLGQFALAEGKKGGQYYTPKSIVSLIVEMLQPFKGRVYDPPFNMKQWWNEKLANDPRWIAGTPPQNNANFAWLQHMLWHLAPSGSMALLLANGSMSSNTNNEGEIRKRLIEDDYVECMVALPGQLFTNTQVPACGGAACGECEVGGRDKEEFGGVWI